MSRAGRKRSSGVNRYPNGQIHRAQPLAGIVPEEALLRRAEAANMPAPTTEGHRARLCAATEAATAAGAMFAHGMISARQYEAAKRFESLSAGVRRLTGAPIGWKILTLAADNGDAAPPALAWDQMTIEQQERAREQWDRIRATLRRITEEIRARTRKVTLVRTALESVVIDNIVPPVDRPFALDALVLGLDAVAAVYRLPMGHAAPKPVVLAKCVDART